MDWNPFGLSFVDPSLEEQERLAAENAAALADPEYVDPWGAMLLGEEVPDV